MSNTVERQLAASVDWRLGESTARLMIYEIPSTSDILLSEHDIPLTDLHELVGYANTLMHRLQDAVGAGPNE